MKTCHSVVISFRISSLTSLWMVIFPFPILPKTLSLDILPHFVFIIRHKQGFFKFPFWVRDTKTIRPLMNQSNYRILSFGPQLYNIINTISELVDWLIRQPECTKLLNNIFRPLMLLFQLFIFHLDSIFYCYHTTCSADCFVFSWGSSEWLSRRPCPAFHPPGKVVKSLKSTVHGGIKESSGKRLHFFSVSFLDYFLLFIVTFLRIP